MRKELSIIVDDDFMPIPLERAKVKKGFEATLMQEVVQSEYIILTLHKLLFAVTIRLPYGRHVLD